MTSIYLAGVDRIQALKGWYSGGIEFEIISKPHDICIHRRQSTN